MTPGGLAGDLSVVFDRDRRFLAIGLFDPDSPIRVKVLHVGSPVTVDTAFFIDRVVQAIRRREPLMQSAHTNAFRCINGENDGFPGLVVDRYDEVAVVKLYSACWFPWLDAIVEALTVEAKVHSMVLRLARRVDHPDHLGDGSALFGSIPSSPVPFVENGLRFDADVIDGHKTGHFLDQRDNRQRVRHLSRGRDVLDVFSCTGGFTVYAAAGDASSVTSVDISPAAIDAVTRNLAANGFRTPHRGITGDAFAVMDDLIATRRRFGVVIVDPPSFAQKQSSVEAAAQAYVRLNRRAMTLLSDGGLLVAASCSSRIDADFFFELVHEAAELEGVVLQEIERTGHALDHPVSFREGAYLKALFARIERRARRR